jgi:hypothetical protein
LCLSLYFKILVTSLSLTIEAKYAWFTLALNFGCISENFNFLKLNYNKIFYIKQRILNNKKNVDKK